MKNINKFTAVVLFFLLITFDSFCQIDSAAIQTLVQTGITVADATNNNIIPNVPNSITSSLLTIVVGIIIRFFEKRKLKKQLAAASNV
jgi:hypothetical protein